MINETNSNSVQTKRFKPLKEEKRKHYYSGRFGKKAEMMKQFYKAKIYLKNLIENKGKGNTVEEEIVPIDLGSYCVVNSSDKEHDDNDSDTSISPLSKLQRHYIKILSSPTIWLDDKVIHKAQQLIKKKFPNIDGFQDPVLYDHFVPVKGKFVQVLNVNKNHWVCVAGDGNNEIHIYDSLLIKIDIKSMHVIAKMLKCEGEVFLTKTVPVQKQSNSSDCGLFALAFAFDLASNLDPSIISYNEEILRKHLLACIENEEITEFPKTNEWLARTKDKTIFETHEVFCSCRDVFFEDDIKRNPKNFMAECCNCGEWFHQKCMNIPTNVFTLPDASWECNQCIR